MLPYPHETAFMFSSQRSHKEEKTLKTPVVKVRVICTDPDATDSSSDEEQEKSSSSSRFPKRMIREIFVPGHPSFFSFTGEDLSSCRRPKVIGHPKKNSLWTKRAETFKNKKMSSCFHQRRNGVRAPSASSSQYAGMMQRRRGKWSAEIRDQSKCARLWLGAYGSRKTAPKTYDTAAKKVRASVKKDHIHRSLLTKKGPDMEDGAFSGEGKPCFSSLQGSTSSLTCEEEADVSNDGIYINEDEELALAYANFDFDDILRSPSTDESESDSLISLVSSDCWSQSVATADVDVLAVEPLVGGEILCYEGSDMDMRRGSSSSSSIRAELRDALEDAIFDGDESIDDLDFDLTMEELTWINVTDGCKV